MTVRWKPLLILSGLFLVIAVLGVIAMVYALVPRGSGDILPLARADRAAKQYDKALIHYQRALQKDGRNPAIHEEMASMFGEWAAQSTGDTQVKLQNNELDSLRLAAEYGKNLKEPRKKLLAECMRRDLSSRSVLWAQKVLELEPRNSDAHYVLASEGLESTSPRIPEIKQHITALEAEKASPIRLAWVKARFAQESKDEAAMKKILADTRSTTLEAKADPVDQMALLRLRALDIRSTTDPDELSNRVAALQKDLNTLLAGPAPAPSRITRLSLMLEGIQKSLLVLASNSDAQTKPAITKLVDGIESDVENLFKKALEGSKQSDLQIYLSYADHLRFRQKREECLKLVKEALATPLAARPTMVELVMQLRAVAVEAALSQVDAPDRLEQSEPHIKELIGCSLNRFQGLGHLFQGAIELEQSGVAGPGTQGGKLGEVAKSKDTNTAAQQKLRVSALNHLKIAATLLPDVAEAQARYGVALVLSQEQALGRQYLQNARRLQNLDPQYQVWAAWSMVQAGYPEEAEPIVAQLLDQIAQGKQSRDLEATLHLLNGEIFQARRGVDDLRKALAEYEKSTKAGSSPIPAVQLRLAQIEVQLGRHDAALKRIAALRKVNLGGPAAEHLAVLTLKDQDKLEEARKVLDDARKRFPDSDELAGLDAAMLLQAKGPEAADKVLTDFLALYPDNIGVVLMRAQILADNLKKPAEARKLLVSVADRSDNSAPFVQLALLDLKLQDFAAVTATISKIRARWKEAAVADLLEAQMALDQNNATTARLHFDEALKKDPGNKLVQFWKAQLDSRNGATKDAADSFEAIAKAKSTKQINPGLTLMAAAESALAGIALESGDIDGAIQRLEDIRKKANPDTQNGGLSRADRWQLASAYAAKGQLAQAKKEIATLLNEPGVSADERVRAANFYRIHGENDAAITLLREVLKTNPGHPSAVVTQAYILSSGRDKRNDEAAGLLRTAINVHKENPPAVFFLMLAAIKAQSTTEKDGAINAMTVLEEGLKAQPESRELVQAKYRVLAMVQGEKKEAVAFVESKAKTPELRRLLIEVYRDQKDYTAAERSLRELLKESPKDSQVAANLVRIVAIQSIDAADRDRRDEEKKYRDRAFGLIRDFRQQFPNDLAFLQTECDLAARHGELARALEITQEMDKISKASPVGPLTRGRIFSAQGRLREAATAYQEALQRDPRLLDVRMALGQVSLKLDETEEALNQAKTVLDLDHDRPDAILLAAQALAAKKGPKAQEAANRAKAVELLTTAIARNPKFSDAYQLKAEIQFKSGDRDRGLATLRECHRALPEDAAGIAQLIQHLCEQGPKGQGANPTNVVEAKTVADNAGNGDKRGNLMLAIAVGYHKAGELSMALPWAQKAATKLDTPLVHLNYGDLLLSIAEATEDSSKAKDYFNQAIEQYDNVLRVQANSVEAINNKAWILHTHLSNSRDALELTQALLKRVDPATLPGEFYDTMGSIQEAMGKTQEAEDSYRKGLNKSINHPVLNFHMGRLISKDRRRESNASGYLEKAFAGRDRLSPEMIKDLNDLAKKLHMNAN
ncbi:tetratricopeptide repeat protein [Singulisphaera sp. PoT]|uniref:tetratricopeptide repeat protein n=1 Tax=Singulisphaera sp. PoT TaxID=3411797 RepID=UPI003BF4E9B1